MTSNRTTSKAELMKSLSSHSLNPDLNGIRQRIAEMRVAWPADPTAAECGNWQISPVESVQRLFRDLHLIGATVPLAGYWRARDQHRLACQAMEVIFDITDIPDLEGSWSRQINAMHRWYTEALNDSEASLRLHISEATARRTATDSVARDAAGSNGKRKPSNRQARAERHEVLPDGPSEPEGWVSNGKLIEGLGKKTCKYAAVLWERRASTNKWVSLSELAEPVLGDRTLEVSAGRAGNWRRTVNEFCEEHSIPWRAAISGGLTRLESSAEKEKSEESSDNR